LSERRFLVDLPKRALALQKPSLSADLLHLLAAEVEIGDEMWKSWQQAWDQALRACGELENAPTRLKAARRGYYTHAAAALWAEHPSAAFWIVARTWALAAAHLPADSPHRAAFGEVCAATGLDAPADLKQIDARLEALDHYLDSIEETLDSWGRKNGATLI
jgi:hypothetical protein